MNRFLAAASLLALASCGGNLSTNDAALCGAGLMAAKVENASQR